MSAFDRLFHALDHERFDDDSTQALIDQLGPTARLARALARARRRHWASTRLDALALPEGEPVHELVAGTLLFVARDYHAGLERLRRAAASRSATLALQAGELLVRLSGQLGWVDEQRAAWSTLGRDLQLPLEIQRRLDAARFRREQAKIQRGVELLELDVADAAARAFARLALDGADAALESLAALRERHGPAPALVVTQVRVELVLGRLDRATALLAERSGEAERFAGVRAALALALGDLDQAIVRTTHHREDAWLLALRGEALERLGQFAEASELLERARKQAPSSVSVALTLALARHRGADDPLSEALEQRFADLLERAPVLLSDAARVVGVDLWTDRGPIREREGIEAILASARGLLTADRDPWTNTYRIAEGPLRLVAPPQPEEHLARLHALDADDAKIQLAHHTLFRALGPRRSSTTATRGPALHIERWRASTLRPDEIDRFLAEGFLILRGCFDPDISERWIADANRRIREEPAKWVKGYDPNDPAHCLADYDPERPETWTWPRINLEGSEQVSIEAFAPRGWGAICDLLGGPSRITTRTWTNYLIANLNADAHLDVPGPGRDWTSWHIDDPSPVTRLDRITQGLVGIAIHSPLGPRAGGTWLAPDSVGKVSRLLAAHPEGVDLCSGRGAGITRECERFFEVTGEVGDLLLIHPLMMHSCAPNPSGRIRWMGNPMVYLERPLEPLRHADLSPVEELIRMAIEPRSKNTPI